MLEMNRGFEATGEGIVYEVEVEMILPYPELGT